MKEKQRNKTNKLRDVKLLTESLQFPELLKAVFRKVHISQEKDESFLNEINTKLQRKMRR